MKELITMFSMPPLGVFQYDGDLNYLKDFARNNEYQGTQMRNLQSLNTYVLDQPKLKELKQFCLDSIHQYSKETTGINHIIEVQQSWFNICQSNTGVDNHYHSNSFLSGVFYITEGSPITFNSDVFKTNFSIATTPPSPEAFLPATIPSFSYPVTPGLLLIFSSNTNHCVYPHTSNQDRISLAFNTYPKLPYGNKQQLTLVRNNHNASTKK